MPKNLDSLLSFLENPCGDLCPLFRWLTMVYIRFLLYLTAEVHGGQRFEGKSLSMHLCHALLGFV